MTKKLDRPVISLPILILSLPFYIAAIPPIVIAFAITHLYEKAAGLDT
jgi:hypothetical protein